MSFLNTTVVSNDVLIRQARRHVHCLFMATIEVPRQQMFSVCTFMEGLENNTDLAALLQFAATLESFGIDNTALAFEMSQTRI